MSVEPRGSWTTVAMTCPVRNPHTSTYKGAAVHWPGIKGRSLLFDSHEGCRAELRSIEHDQMTRPDPYGALAYQVVVCGAHARVVEGRTRRRVNGANGSTASNLAFGSIMVLVSTSDPVSDAVLHAVHEAAAYLGVSRLLTHNQVRPEPTACPGPRLTAWIEAGAPDPEEDMPTAAEIAAATVALLMRHPMENRVKQAAGDPDPVSTYKSLLEGTYLRAYMAADPDALAAAIVHELPVGEPVTEQALAAALRSVLGSLDVAPGTPTP